jgi:hypothetical protein
MRIVAQLFSGVASLGLIGAGIYMMMRNPNIAADGQAGPAIIVLMLGCAGIVFTIAQSK